MKLLKLATIKIKVVHRAMMLECGHWFSIHKLAEEMDCYNLKKKIIFQILLENILLLFSSFSHGINPTYIKKHRGIFIHWEVFVIINLLYRCMY